MPVSDDSMGRDSHRLLLTAALVALHVAAFGLSFEPLAAWPLIPLALALLTWLAVRARSTRSVVLLVLLGHGVLWVLMSGWMRQVTPQGFLLLPLYVAAYPAAFCWLLRRSVARLRLPFVVLVPVLWVGMEALRGYVVFGGYPWYLLGHPLIDAPLLPQVADLFGASLLSVLVALVAGAMVDVFWTTHSRRIRILSPLTATALLVATAVYGAVAIARHAHDESDADALRVLVVQTNLPQDNKLGWTAEQQATDVPKFFELTRAALAEHANVDLIVWPETMLPGVGVEPETIAFLRRLPADFSDYYRWVLALQEFQRELGVPMLIGSPSWINVGTEPASDGYLRLDIGAQYNSAYLIDADQPVQRYDKVHLTPFGETMPYVSAWPWLEEQVLNFGAHGMSFSLDASPTLNTLTLASAGHDVTLATPICYEDSIASVCRRMLRSTNDDHLRVIINLSNDGWFGASDGARATHNQLARFRCIENRVPMVRAANTGQSVAINALGKVIETVGEGRYGEARRAGSLVADLALVPSTTLYARVGDVPAWACLAGTGVFLILVFRKRAGAPNACAAKQTET